jgi:MYXO-CTERM domain-containing protein
MSVAWLLVAGAFAGYGDAVDGLPSRDERELHVWTNAVRVDPEAFKDDYACSWDRFTADEQTPKAPLLWNADLNEAARFHADDMATNDCFQHDSCDGTPWDTRIMRYYPSGNISENIAWGNPDARSAVIEGWMCSEAGHRKNIMTAGWEELGPGQNGVFYVQDFGIRDIPDRAIGMGVHIENGARITYYADFYHPDRLAPGLFDVVVDGFRVPLTVEYGEAWRGIYKAQSQPGDGCHTYYFEVIAGGETTTFPEDGAYGWGPCEYDDAAAGWLAERVEAEPGEPDTDTGSEVEPDTDIDTDAPTDTGSSGGGVCGCATGSGPGSGFLLALGVLLARRRGTPRR